jgi:hypothetical protein
MFMMKGSKQPGAGSTSTTRWPNLFIVDAQKSGITSFYQLLTDADFRHKQVHNGFALAQVYSWETTGEKVERAI